ncbi:MAG: Hsp70 family protein, partial [Planctomycetes bacterium]|nr:Hsp70 family protein [Planctomycetota bacterium]
ANQRQMALNVYQGEARRVSDNLLLGRLEVDGIPPGPAGQVVVVRFTYDVDGMLEVEAIVDATGRRFSALLNHQTLDLTAREIEAARQRLRSIKFYPRDDLANQDLLLFAERVIGEVSTQQRKWLDEALAFYEAALHDSDRDTFAAARSALLEVLQLIGHPWRQVE